MNKVLRGKEWYRYLEQIFDLENDFFDKEHDCSVKYSIVDDDHDRENYIGDVDTETIYHH
ncbi:MAG: hypothetical protein ACOC80_09810 [Petrotogales bacterium]